MERNILIVNDDGIHAAGIARLAAAAAEYGRVWVAAPDRQCSGMSQKLSLFEEIPVRRVDFPVPAEAAYSVGGTPADCVKLALGYLLPVRPDAVFSGINRGYNAGFDVAYSGTVGAAMEARMKGIPAFAFSTDMNDEYSCADAYLPSVLRELLGAELAADEIWNVNFPGCPASEVRGVLRDRVPARTQFYLDRYDEAAADGARVFVSRSERLGPGGAEAGSDIAAVLDGWVSVGKLRCALLR